MFIFGVNTGYRISALLSLKIKDVWQHDEPVKIVSIAKRHRKMGKSKGTINCPGCGYTGPIPEDFDKKCPKCGEVVKVIRAKKAEGRSVPLNDKAKKAISDLISFYKTLGLTDPNTFLFRSRKFNEPISRSSAWRIINDAAWAARISGKIGTHTMRKTFALNVFNAFERDLFKTKIALGHQSIDSTIQYLQQDNEEINNAIMNL
jgi:site-specific recombinase XerD